MIGFCSSPRFVEHDTGPNHPERPDRIRAVYTALHAAGMIRSNPFPEFSVGFGDFGTMKRARSPLQELTFSPASRKWVELVHPPHYVDRIEHVCQSGGGVLDQGDTVVCPASYEIALLAVGAVLRCCDAVTGGEVVRAFAAVRPPGHHAEPDRAMGFCLFSNVAIAARYLKRIHGIERVAIIDFDVHHGNGTQACFDNDPSIYFASIHQHPRTCYPGSGYDWEIGTGVARGYTMNVPFKPGAGDAEYLSVFDKRIVPEIEEFGPQVLLISAGFDAHLEDPLADMQLSEEGYELMTRSLVAVADRTCDGRVVSVLEGGYNLRALGRSVVRHLVGLGAQ